MKNRKKESKKGMDENQWRTRLDQKIRSRGTSEEDFWVNPAGAPVSAAADFGHYLAALFGGLFFKTAGGKMLIKTSLNDGEEKGW